MTEAQYIDAVSHLPTFSQWKADEAFKRAAVETFAKKVFDKLVMRHPWLFATGRATQATTIDASDYTLKGNRDDAAQIANIKYGDGKKLLVKYDENAYDELLSSYAATNEDGSTDTTLDSSTPKLWFPLAPAGGFPRVRIYGTPASVETMYYTYWKKNLSMEVWPDEWAMVLIFNIEAALFGSGSPYNSEVQWRSSDPSWIVTRANDELVAMIGHYERSGGEDSPAPLGRRILAKFRRRSDLNGY